MKLLHVKENYTGGNLYLQEEMKNTENDKYLNENIILSFSLSLYITYIIDKIL